MNKNIAINKIDLQNVSVHFGYGNAQEFLNELCETIGVQNVLNGIMKMYPSIKKITIEMDLEVNGTK